MRPVGMGAIKNWAGKEELELFKKYHGKKITRVSLQDNEFVMWFDVGSLTVVDEGQSCCESRYITCDDDIHSIVGGALLDIDYKEGPDIDVGDGDCHETCFVEVCTSAGFINMTSHNEHNGYYGGFAIGLKGQK